jgi:parallel beta-helix repeat protein
VRAAVAAAAAAGGGRVLFPSGTCLARPANSGQLAPVNIASSNVALVGTGASVLYNDVIGGNGDGQLCVSVAPAGATNLDNILLQDLTLKNAGSAFVPADAGLSLFYYGNNGQGGTVSNLRVVRCRFQTLNRTCLALGGTVTGFLVRDCVFDSIAETGIYLAGPGCSNGLIAGNRLGPSAVPGSNGIALRSATNVIVQGNIIEGATLYGIACRDNFATDCQILDNTVINCTTAGAVGIGMGVGLRLRVAGNKVDNCNGQGVYLVPAAAVQDVCVESNLISRCGAGILLDVAGPALSNVRLLHNTLCDMVGFGIQTNSVSGWLVVRGNTVNYQAGGKAEYPLASFSVPAGAFALYEGNLAKGYTLAPYYATGTTTRNNDVL